MTTCAKCGAENVAGDAFCGACGAFLEFAAEEAADVAAESAQPGAPLAVADAAAGTLPPPPAAGPGATLPSEPAVAAGGAPVPPAPAGPTCAACGRANPAGRRFCISCGERLPAAPGQAAARPATGAPGPGSVAPGPATVPAVPAGATPPAAGSGRPAWEFPTTPVPVGAARPDTFPVATSSAASSGGRSRLPLIGGALVLLALVGGGAVLVLSGGGAPGLTPSAPPSSAVASPTPGAEPSAVPSAPPATPATSEPPAATPVPTAPSGPTVGIAVTAATASSQLAANRAPKYLYDGSPLTAWKSATGDLEGSWVEVSFVATAVTKIQIWTGWQRGDAVFYGNHRPRNVTVAFDGGVPVPLELKDVLGAQGVPIPPALGIVSATRLRITIIDTWPSRKTSAAGSPSKEVAISEIRIFGILASP